MDGGLKQTRGGQNGPCRLSEGTMVERACVRRTSIKKIRERRHKRLCRAY